MTGKEKIPYGWRSNYSVRNSASVALVQAVTPEATPVSGSAAKEDLYTGLRNLHYEFRLKHIRKINEQNKSVIDGLVTGEASLEMESDWLYVGLRVIRKVRDVPQHMPSYVMQFEDRDGELFPILMRESDGVFSIGDISKLKRRDTTTYREKNLSYVDFANEAMNDALVTLSNLDEILPGSLSHEGSMLFFSAFRDIELAKSSVSWLEKLGFNAEKRMKKIFEIDMELGRLMMLHDLRSIAQ